MSQPAREYQKAAQQAGDLRSIQQAFRQLGRALFMRQLVSAACEAELSSSVPYIPAAVRCAEAHAAWSAGKGEEKPHLLYL